MLVNAFKNIAGISLEIDYKLAALDAAKSASSAQQAEVKKDEPKKVEEQKPVEEKEEPEEDMDMGGLFD